MTLIFVTDLDGTLLDHETYSYAAAEPALRALKTAGIPLVLASSKTAAEIMDLHRSLSLGAAPAIVENGAGVLNTGHACVFDDTEYLAIRDALGDLPNALRTKFRGFGDMTDADVAAETGLDHQAAHNARTRSFSEPGLWSGSASELTRFCAALSDRGVHARQGGRFLTLSHGRTKADAMGQVTRQMDATRVVALGDAPNDAEMLEAADIGIIVRNDAGAPMPKLKGEASNSIRRTELEGPSGWNQAVLEILDEWDGS